MTRSVFRFASGTLLVLLAAACASKSLPLPTPEQIPAPAPEQVERVIFLVGDPGEARTDYYPVMPRLQQDIEWWAERLPADTSVSVLFLGDIVYPLGLHPPGHELFPHDSAIVMDQVRLLAGPFAKQRNAQGWFMAGNHDWGLEKEWEGYDRLKNLDDFLRMARQHTGAGVHLVPEAGTGGPFVVDMGAHIRLVILDTSWWLLDAAGATEPVRQKMLGEVEAAIRTAGARAVVITAHHPFKTAGPHGGTFSVWRTLGARFLLVRSGAILQDITSAPYRDLERGLREVFARAGTPTAFVGGHEHSLQVIGATAPTDPNFSIVSGSASKLSSVTGVAGMRFGRSAPGYMRLLVLKNGELQLFVEAAPPRFKSCPKTDPARQICMTEGIAAFQTVHSQRIR